MKDLKILIISVIFLSFLGCATLKINPSEEKIGVLGKDYKIRYLQRREGCTPVISVKVFEENNKSVNEYFLEVNRITTKIKNGEESVFYLTHNQKYNFRIDDMWHKSIYILGIKANTRDSIMLNVYCNDHLVKD